MDHGFFGMVIDFDHNSHLDALERAADFSMFMGVMEENAKIDFWDDDFAPDDDDC